MSDHEPTDAERAGRSTAGADERLPDAPVTQPVPPSPTQPMTSSPTEPITPTWAVPSEDPNLPSDPSLAGGQASQAGPPSGAQQAPTPAPWGMPSAPGASYGTSPQEPQVMAGYGPPAPPAHGGAASWVARGPRRSRLLWGAGAAAAAVLLLGTGFVAGAVWHRHDATRLISPTSQNGPSGAERRDGRSWGDSDDQGRRGPGVDSSRYTAGRITAISGSTLTLQSFGGTSVTVKVSSSTTVGGTTGGNLTGLKVGEFVLVTGSRQSDGSYVASAITTRGTDRNGGQQGLPGQAGQPGQPGQAALWGAAGQAAPALGDGLNA
jgi:hypothetical protein